MGAVVAAHAIDRDGDQCRLLFAGLEDLLAAVEPVGLTWWRRCVSPLVGSTAIAGALR